MKKLGITLFGSGFFGFLCGGSGLDGQSATANAILIVVSLMAAAVGYRLWAVAEQKEARKKAQEERREREDEAAKEAIVRAKEATFQVWLESGKLDVPV